MNTPYREVELPPLAHSPLWDTYVAQRERIAELERALDATQDTIGDIRTKWMALKAKYGMDERLIEDVP